MSLVGSFTDLAKLPVEALKGMSNNIGTMLFVSCFAFFALNTDGDKIQQVGTNLVDGNISGALESIVDMSINFKDNVKDNFDPENLSKAVQGGLCKLMESTEDYECQ